jgi:alcohol dehydrogenase class IV
VLALRREIAVPHTLVAAEIPLDQAGRIPEMAVLDPTSSGNPVTLTKQAPRRIFDHAARGALL